MFKYYHDDCFNILPIIEDNSIDSIIIDPPYITTSESWDKEEVVNELLSEQLFRIAKQSSSLYVWCGIGEKSNSLCRWLPIFSKHWYFKDLITWKKQRGLGNKKGWLYTREECMWFVKDNKKFFWNEKEQYDKKDKRLFTMPNNKSEYKRYTNVWTDIEEESGSMKSSRFHFTQKPVELIERCIKLSTIEDQTVLDCFGGSGTTAVACANTKRNCILIDKNICDIKQSSFYNIPWVDIAKQRVATILNTNKLTEYDKKKLCSLF